MLRNLLLNAPVVSDNDNAIAAVEQLRAEFTIAHNLGGLVVDGPIAENTDVWAVKEIRDAPRFWNRLLRLVGERMVAYCHTIEKPSLDFRSGISERAQPCEMRVPIATCDSRERATAGNVE